jgi:hypothetical protein
MRLHPKKMGKKGNTSSSSINEGFTRTRCGPRTRSKAAISKQLVIHDRNNQQYEMHTETEIY